MSTVYLLALADECGCVNRYWQSEDDNSEMIIQGQKSNNKTISLLCHLRQEGTIKEWAFNYGFKAQTDMVYAENYMDIKPQTLFNGYYITKYGEWYKIYTPYNKQLGPSFTNIALAKEYLETIPPYDEENDDDE